MPRIIITYRRGRHVACFQDRDHKMQIGVHQFAKLDAGGAGATCVMLLPVHTGEILQHGKGKGQFATSLGAKQHKGMRGTVIPNQFPKFLLYFLLPYDLLKQHCSYKL